jgi:hypothetical protein
MKRHIKDDIFHPRRSGRFGPEQIDAAQARHYLYLMVRDHARFGWNSLPLELTQANRHEIAAMAKARSDHAVLRLLSRPAAPPAPTV